MGGAARPQEEAAYPNETSSKPQRIERKAAMQARRRPRPSPSRDENELSNLRR